MANQKNLGHFATGSGYALGGIRWTLRLEGLAVLALTIAAYWQLDGSWWWFFGLLLWPDLAFFAYIKSQFIGAHLYNALHSYIGPLAIGLIGSVADQQTIMLFALIWTAHIGMDRFAGYGLKYPALPDVTHLGLKGKSAT